MVPSASSASVYSVRRLRCAQKAVWPRVTVLACDASDEHIDVCSALRRNRSCRYGSRGGNCARKYRRACNTGSCDSERSAAACPRVIASRMRHGLISSSTSHRSNAPSQAPGARVEHFVATHPMAGSHTHGPAAADAKLFVERCWALVPSGKPAVDAAARDFIGAMGARVVEIDAERHDRIVARTSHLPQAVSTVLARIALREPVEGLTRARTRRHVTLGPLSGLRLARHFRTKRRPDCERAGNVCGGAQGVRRQPAFRRLWLPLTLPFVRRMRP